ncbi:MAG: hypothetical protein M1823_001399, partial [Watsoniomyces obsoletus]
MMDQEWLNQCTEDNMPQPAFDRYIHLLPEHVVKKRLGPGEEGYEGWQPNLSTLEMRDENEILALDLVREHTSIPIPKLIHRGVGFNVFERLQGITIVDRYTWEKVTPRQKEAIRLQIHDYIKQLAKIPHPDGGIRSLLPSGEIFHVQLPHRGPFDSTKSFLEAYADEKMEYIHQIPPESIPVFSHLDWDLSNIVLYPNMDAVVGVIDWERACFFPESGK